MSMQAYTEHNARIPERHEPSRNYPRHARLYAVSGEPVERMRERIRAAIESSRTGVSKK